MLLLLLTWAGLRDAAAARQACCCTCAWLACAGMAMGEHTSCQDIIVRTAAAGGRGSTHFRSSLWHAWVHPTQQGCIRSTTSFSLRSRQEALGMTHTHAAPSGAVSLAEAPWTSTASSPGPGSCKITHLTSSAAAAQDVSAGSPHSMPHRFFSSLSFGQGCRVVHPNISSASASAATA